MAINRQNLSIVIVTIKSEKVIHQCVSSIDKDIPITVVENSNNLKFKNELEDTYSNVNCLLTNHNIGMGSGNNLGIKSSITNYVLILNPDVILEKNTINELIEASKKISDFTILSPISSDNLYPNYKISNNKSLIKNEDLPFQVKSVDGYSMIFNKKNIDKIIRTKNFDYNYFDENFFMYLENDDLCKRINDNGGNIFIAPTAKIKHLGAKAVDNKYHHEVELSRNWHWMWSKFYYNKKHHGMFKAINDGFIRFILNTLKYLFFLLTNNKYKKKIYYNRISGFYNALIGKKSWYRPNFKD